MKYEAANLYIHDGFKPNETYYKVSIKIYYWNILAGDQNFEWFKIQKSIATSYLSLQCSSYWCNLIEEIVLITQIQVT